MSVLVELEQRLASLKSKAEGDFHDLVLKLEAVFQHIHASHTEDVVKEAVATELNHAAIKVDNIVNQVRLATDAVETATKKK